MAQGSHYHQLRLAEKAAELKPEDEGDMGCASKVVGSNMRQDVTQRRGILFFWWAGAQ